jgi:O-antigen/teichoic acid export membrane protein
LWFLLIGPLLACATGLSGNILVMTGHNLWNLTNSVLLLLVLSGLNWLWIPRYGLTGASLATMVAITGLAGLQIVEVWYIHKIRVEVARLWKPFAAGGVALGLGWLIGGLVEAQPAVLRVAVKVPVMLVIYLGSLLVLGLDPEDRATVDKWRAKRRLG